MNLDWIKLIDDEQLAESLDTTKHDISLARGEDRVEVQVDCQRLWNRHTLGFMAGHGITDGNRELDQIGGAVSSVLELVRLQSLLNLGAARVLSLQLRILLPCHLSNILFVESHHKVFHTTLAIPYNMLEDSSLAVGETVLCSYVLYQHNFGANLQLELVHKTSLCDRAITTLVHRWLECLVVALEVDCIDLDHLTWQLQKILEVHLSSCLTGADDVESRPFQILMTLWSHPRHQELLILLRHLPNPHSSDSVQKIGKHSILSLAMVCQKIDHTERVPEVLVTVGEVVGWIGWLSEDKFTSNRLKLEDVSKAKDGHVSKDLFRLLDLLKSEIQHVKHVGLDKGNLVDDDHHKLLELDLPPVSIPVLHAGELVAKTKLECARQSQATDVGGCSPGKRRLEDIGLLW